VTFTFVTTRTLAELGILPSLGRDPFATLVWLSWSMPLLATEVILQGRKVMARSSANRPLQPSAGGARMSPSRPNRGR
jgi:hypothetical protein